MGIVTCESEGGQLRQGVGPIHTGTILSYIFLRLRLLEFPRPGSTLVTELSGESHLNLESSATQT